MKRENVFRTQLCRAIQAAWGREVYFQKHHGTMFSSGLPDMLVFRLGMGGSFLELKAIDSLPARDTSIAWDWSKELTDLQFATLRRISEAGARARVVLYVHPLKRVLAMDFNQLKFLRETSSIWTVEQLCRALGNGNGPDWACVDWDGERTPTVPLTRLIWGG